MQPRQGERSAIPATGYRERPAAAPLQPYLSCVWTQSASRAEHRIVPDACIDIVWGGGLPLHVAGPDTGPAIASTVPGSRVVGLRFRPGLAPPLLGVPASDLRDARVDLGHLWGTAARDRLQECLAAAPSAGLAAAVLERELIVRLPAARPADVLVAALVERLGRGLGIPRSDVGERQLRRRCIAAVGFGPKTLERVLRFQRFRTLALRTRPPLAELAPAAGYADQAHLTRECLRLSGLTPAAYLRTL